MIDPKGDLMKEAKTIHKSISVEIKNTTHVNAHFDIFHFSILLEELFPMTPISHLAWVQANLLPSMVLLLQYW